MLLVLLLINKKIFENRTDQSIYLATVTLLEIQGNLGIPLNRSFGVESVPYTSIINIANVLFILCFQYISLQEKKFSLRDAILEIFKTLVLVLLCFALFINYQGIGINKHIYTALEMGAYTLWFCSFWFLVCIYLVLKSNLCLGIYLLNISFVKHIMLPLLGINNCIKFYKFKLLCCFNFNYGAYGTTCS